MPEENDKKLDVAPWLAAIALVASVVAVVLAASTLSRQEGGTATPAGMGGMTTEQGTMMGGHAAEVPINGIREAPARRGGTPLRGVRRNGATEYRLDARPVWWRILKSQRLAAYAYNGIVPGPEIQARNGERLRIRFLNRLPVPTTMHWHGVGVPNAMDGVPGVTQKPIKPGESFTYEFQARPAGDPNGGGTFMYHSHVDEERQMSVGLAGALIIEPPRKGPHYALERTMVLSEWTANAGTGRTRGVMPAEGNFPNFFTINGRAFPETDELQVRRGQPALLRIVNAGQFSHPMHLHGTSFRVVGRDGHEVANSGLQDTVTVSSGERVDIAFAIDRPGKWIFHCHIGHHMTNNGEGPGGLITVLHVR